MDRQDIDALLISALYGELTPADEARLTMHLESHPTDRTALADLTRARLAVRESRILERQVEPPQSVSALLLQEAARRAPRRVDPEKQSWLQRLLMSLVAHPAMAAAATLVLVVGVAGSLYMRDGGDQFADKTAARSDEAAPPSPVAATDPAMESPRVNLAPGASSEVARDRAAAGSASSYQVHLDETTTATTKPDSSRIRPTPTTTPPPPAAHAAAPPKNVKDGLIVGRKESPAPRELDADKDNKSFDATVGNADVNGAPAFRPTPDAKLAKQQDQPAKGGDAAKTVPASPPAVSTGSTTQGQDRRVVDKKAEEERKADDDLVWARNQLAQAKAFKQAKNCPAAAAIIVAIQKRTPDFYNQTVATDRDLKECRTYVDLAREKDESQKSRATKRASPAPADLEQTH